MFRVFFFFSRSPNNCGIIVIYHFVWHWLICWQNSLLSVHMCVCVNENGYMFYKDKHEILYFLQRRILSTILYYYVKKACLAVIPFQSNFWFWHNVTLRYINLKLKGLCILSEVEYFRHDGTIHFQIKFLFFVRF